MLVILLILMKVAVLFSGGKDSVYAAHWATTQGFDVILITVKPPDYSMMFHHPCVNATSKQAEAMELPQIFIETTEENWKDELIKALREVNAEGIVTGAIESEYQKKRIDAIGQELNIPTYSPFWHKGKELLQEMLDAMDVRVSAVSAEGLGPEFLGEPLQKIINAKLPNIHPFLEGGEGETFVVDAVFFKHKFKVMEWKKTWDGVRGTAEAVVD